MSILKKELKRRKRKIVKQVKTGMTVAKLAIQVAQLARSLNVEKKSRTITTTAGTSVKVGMQNNSADGAYHSHVNISPPQGTGGSDRVGNSIKIVSAMFQARIQQQLNTTGPIKYRWFIFNRPDNTVDLSSQDMFDAVFDENPFSGYRDYFANRDPEYFTQFKVIAKGSGNLKADTATGNQGFAHIKQPLKLSLHQKYDSSESVTTTKNKLYLIVQCDTGDVGSASNGMLLQYDIKYYYVDN